VEQALDHAVSRARAAGKLAAVYAASGSRAAELGRRGFQFISVASDTVLLRSGAQAALAAARA
jgi:4-hydroxy-2-oxoheptanedioate aldolase